MAYATRDDLVAWLVGGDYVDLIPADPARLLERASEVIADALAGQLLYDEEGLPSGMVTPLDPPVSADDLQGAVADAVCAQIEQWMEVGEENDIAGWPAGTSMQLSAGAVTKLPDRVAPRAVRRLARVGLTPGGGTDLGGSGVLTVELI